MIIVSDVATKCKQSAAQHEGRVVIMTGPNGQIQTIAPTVEKVTLVTVIEAKYDKYFDDTQYYSS